jgi:hypothetical protein
MGIGTLVSQHQKASLYWQMFVGLISLVGIKWDVPIAGIMVFPLVQNDDTASHHLPLPAAEMYDSQYSMLHMYHQY